MFACNDTAPRQHLCEKVIERAFNLLAHRGIAIGPVDTATVPLLLRLGVGQ